MSDNEWEQLRNYIEHSGLSVESVYHSLREAKKYQDSMNQAEPIDPRQLPLPGLEVFNGA